MLLNNRLDQAKSFKVGIPEIPAAIVVSSAALITKPSLGGNVLSLVLPREQSSGQRVVDNDVEAVAPADGD